MPLQQRPFTLLTLKINKTFTISSTCTLKYQFITVYYLIKYPSIHLFTHLSIYLIYPFPCPPIHGCMYPSVCTSIYLSVCRSVHRSSYPSVLLSVYLSVHSFIYPSIHLYLNTEFTCKRLVDIAISPQVISAPYLLHILLKGKLPTYVNIVTIKHVSTCISNNYINNYAYILRSTYCG